MNLKNRYGGRLKYFINEWLAITEDPVVLSIIVGYKIVFNTKPWQISPPSSISFTETEVGIVDNILSELLCLGAIETAKPCNDQYLSSIFLVPKSDGVKLTNSS